MEGNNHTRGAIAGISERNFTTAPLPDHIKNVPACKVAEHAGEHDCISEPFSGVKDWGVYLFLKRLVDIIGSFLGLILFGLLLPFLALLIKLDSKGPVFFRQERVGKDRKTIVIWKLRTMEADAEKKEEIWSEHNDKRVMRVGRWLRKSRLDEIPQCWNILKGEMSIVGPRPERLNVVAKLEKKFPRYHVRHLVKPGLAGWAMVNRGYMCSFDDAKVRLDYDLHYVQHQSFWFDILIFCRAFGHLLAMKGT